MAKKQQERSEVESLRAENKRLSKENKLLKRKSNRKDKRAYQYEDLEDKIQEITLFEDTSDLNHFKPEKKCIKCNKGIPEEIDLGIRTLIKCNECGHHFSKKK